MRPPGAGGGSRPAAHHACRRRRRTAPPARRRDGAEPGGPRDAGPSGESRPTTCNRYASRAGASWDSASGHAETLAHRPAWGRSAHRSGGGCGPKGDHRHLHRHSSGAHSTRRDGPGGPARPRAVLSSRVARESQRSPVAPTSRGPRVCRTSRQRGATSVLPAGSAGSRGESGRKPMTRRVSRHARARERTGRGGRTGRDWSEAPWGRLSEWGSSPKEWSLREEGQAWTWAEMEARPRAATPTRGPSSIA